MADRAFITGWTPEMTERRVGDFLGERIEAGSDLSIVSAYCTIYAYDALRDALESAGRTRFLHGEPRTSAYWTRADFHHGLPSPHRV